MAADLLETVQSELQARKDEWRTIADDLDMSYEFISRLGLGTYGSSPIYANLQRVSEYLRKHPRRANGKAAA
jgi:hypothetical protein